MLSIPEIATQLVNEVTSNPNEEESRTLFFMGSKSVGKSTLLYSFLDKTEPIHETLVLEYLFGRKSNQKQNLVKTVCHIWEYGGKLEMLKNVISSIPMKGKTFFFIIVDLSKVKNIWYVLETCVQAISGYLHDSRNELIIMGGKYDIFRNYDSEIKKHISMTIRSVALIYEAYVFYYSCKDTHQQRKAKEMLFNISFGNGVPFKDKIFTHSKPLLITKNSDSWENIGHSTSSIEEVKIRHIAGIQPETIVRETAKLELQYAHPEPILDSLMSVKYQELRNLELYDTSVAEYFGTDY